MLEFEFSAATLGIRKRRRDGHSFNSLFEFRRKREKTNVYDASQKVVPPPFWLYMFDGVCVVFA